MIRTFRNRQTEQVFRGVRAPGLPPNTLVRAQQKLVQLDQAQDVDQLREPPSNHLEALRGDRARLWSIRNNRQWRICFRWEGSDAHDVEIEDYH